MPPLLKPTQVAMRPVRLIPLTRGLFTLVDADQFEFLSQWKWLAVGRRGRTFYAARNVWVPVEKKYRRVWMHRLILGLDDEQKTDHRNLDGLDNRRLNLRPATTAQNGANVGRQARNTSGFRGVSCDARWGTWVAKIHAQGKTYRLGTFATPADAARAWDSAAVRLFGEFARLNFPSVGAS